jgi:nucleoside-diphosphate-sugar epimerase
LRSTEQREMALDKLRRDGHDVTILRPGATCRTHNSHWGDKLIDRLQQAGWPSSRHPLDVIPWVHADDLAEMVYLCATNEAASGETYLAVDANVSLAEYWVPICQALSRPVLTPDRVPIQSRCRIGKIRRTLGYHPRREFAATLRALLDLASDIPEASRASGAPESDRATVARRGRRPT